MLSSPWNLIVFSHSSPENSLLPFICFLSLLSHFSWKNFGLSAHTNFSFGAYKIISSQVYATHPTIPRVALLPVTSIKLFSLSEPQFFIEKLAWYLPYWVSGISRKGKAYREPHTEHNSQRTCYEAGVSAKKVRIINSLDGKYKISSLAHLYEI